MINNKKIIVVMPAYNAAITLEKTYQEIPQNIVDETILVDDCSYDNTAEVAKRINIQKIIRHETNLGYGGNQKTCYQTALNMGADIVIMLHPDYQYTPKLITAISSLIAEDIYDCVLGSRILGKGAVKGGMPLYKYIANRFLTAFQNILVGQKLSEYHTGYRAFSRAVLESIPMQNNSNDFIFDNQMLVQIIAADFRIGEVSCPTHYSRDSSSINFRRSLQYGIGVIITSISYRIWLLRKKPHPLFSPKK